MSDYSVFRQNVLDIIEKRFSQDILRIKAISLDEIFSIAEEHFSMPAEQLSFEIENIREKSLLHGNAGYVVLVYPSLQNYGVGEEAVLKASDKNGGVLLRFGRGNIYLLVTPPIEDGIPVSFEMVKNLLDKNPLVREYDHKFIKSIMSEAQGKWIQIGKFEHDEECDTKYTVQINKSRMSAFLQIYRSQLHGADVSFADMQKALRDAGIYYGIDEELLHTLEYHPMYNRLVEVANGTPVEQGKDAKIELTVGNTNVINNNVVITVQEGKVVAIKNPFTYGHEGRSVDDDLLYPSPGSDITMLGNENVRINSENTEALALKGGAIVLEGNKVCITELLVINGDITPEVGDINFPGSVIIEGSIPDDYTLNVGGNLQVNGGIANSIIKVKGNLRVVRGINGRGNAQLEVGKSLYTRFIENVDIVTTGEDCIVEEGIINATIESLGRVVALSGKGRVVSSVIRSSLGIYIRAVGSDLGSNSLLYTVSLFEERKNLERLLQLRRSKQEELRRIKIFLGENIEALNLKKMDKAQKVMLHERLKTLQQLQIDLQKLAYTTESIRKKLATVKSTAKIVVEQRIKAGTTISIDDARIDIKSDTQSTVFYLSAGKIVSRVFSDKSDRFDVMGVIKDVF